MKRKEFILAVIISLSVIISTYVFSVREQKQEQENAKLAVNPWDVERGKGLLLPTKDSIAKGYTKDDQYDGFGSNRGCFGSMYWKHSDDRWYCFRFLRSGFIGEIQFEEIHRGNGPINTDQFKIGTALNYLNQKQIGYTIRKFEYNNSEGVLLSYKENSTDVHQTKDNEYSNLYWSDSDNYLTIKLTEIAGDTSTPLQVIDLLRTLRRSNGKKLDALEESTSSPFFTGEPVAN